MSEEKPIETTAANTAVEKPVERKPSVESQVILTRDPNLKRLYCDGVQTISHYHGNVKFQLVTVDPMEEGRPVTRRLVGELVMPLQDFLSCVKDQVVFLNKLRENGIIRDEPQNEKALPTETTSHP